MPTIPAPSTKVLQEVPRKDILRYVNVQPGSLIQGNRVTQRRGLKKRSRKRNSCVSVKQFATLFEFALVCAFLRRFAPVWRRFCAHGFPTDRRISRGFPNWHRILHQPAWNCKPTHNSAEAGSTKSLYMSSCSRGTLTWEARFPLWLAWEWFSRA